MKTKILIPLLLLFSVLTAAAQEAADILKKAYERCQSVENGYYEMTRYMKYMDDKDTVKTTFQCHFKKLPEDTLFHLAFRYQSFWKDKSMSDILYTGDELVTVYSGNDSVATVMPVVQWAEEIRAIRHNYEFYSPLTHPESAPLLQDEDFADTVFTFRYLGEEVCNGIPCYRVQVNELPVNDSADMMKTLREEYHFWIAKADYLPVQFSTVYDLVMANDTMCQYEKIVLTKHELNNLTDEGILTLDALRPQYQFKDYEPYKRPDPLPIDTIAPAWELQTVAGEKVSLEDLRGRLVLADFFYKSCYPCMLALPGLQRLHEKYGDRGLTVVGINPFDTAEDDIGAFLAKRGVTYTVLLGAKEVAKQYRVTAYPTLYLIDRNGVIVHVQEGYGEEAEKELEEVILGEME